jgi:hypothetical protein
LVGGNRRLSARIRFNRHEFAGAFGDIGTDLPLLVGMIPAAGLHSSSVFIVFGALQILTGVIYGLPMPMQPLKAMAVIVISQNIAGNVLHGAGLAIGVIMLALALTGVLTLLAKWVPTCVVRGIQFGLGLLLAQLALGSYVPDQGWPGYLLAGSAFVVYLLLHDNQHVPAGLVIIGLGIIYALTIRLNIKEITDGIGLGYPNLQLPKWTDLTDGLQRLVLPQLALSLANSVIATQRTVNDLFPDRSITIRGIGATYGLANVFSSLFGGVPVCHGCGGLAGHYAFGARTGGSVVIYGSVYLAIGLFFGAVFDRVVEVFPKPLLGVVLLIEALTLLRFIGDQVSCKTHFGIALVVAMCALALPQGFVVGLVGGSVLYYLHQWRQTV